MSDIGSNPKSRPGDLPPDWDVPRLQRLLFAALSRLAKSGWVVAPDDAQDLMQSFFQRLWEQWLPKWDAEQASFATYVHVHFTWFAKSWIMRELRLRQKQVELEVLRDAYLQSASDIAEKGELSATIRQALHRLSPSTRTILLEYLSPDSPSQRELAARYKTTRHDIRAQLIDGMGKLLVEFSQPPDISSNDWQVFCCLYKKGLTVTETARLLRRPVTVIHGIRNSLLCRLASPIRTALRQP